MLFPTALVFGKWIVESANVNSVFLENEKETLKNLRLPHWFQLPSNFQRLVVVIIGEGV